MKKFLFIISIISICNSCKQKENTPSIESKINIAKKIANAHGFQLWENVTEISFTFGGKRHWNWKPKTGDVTLITKGDTIVYNRKSIDSSSLKADRAFINDKFWLLIPFQLVWDEGLTISKPIKAEATVSKTKMNKITLLYNSEGGYTPGDAYDLYFEDDYIIKEWGFRRGNKPEAGLVNTFENYKDYKSIKLALNHKKPNNKNGVAFTNVKITFE